MYPKPLASPPAKGAFSASMVEHNICMQKVLVLDPIPVKNCFEAQQNFN